MGILGLKDKDAQKLKAGLKELRELNDCLSSKYSLRNDIVDIHDRRYALNALFQEEMGKIDDQRKELELGVKDTLQIKEKLEYALSAISEVDRILKDDEEGSSIYNKILSIANEETLGSLKKKIAELVGFYNDLFSEDEAGEVLVEKVRNAAKDILDSHDDLLVDRDEDGNNKFEAAQREIDQIEELYNEYFVSRDEEVSKVQEFESKIKKIDGFYDKVYGNEKKSIKSLKDDLDDRLNGLKEIEGKARSVINLSSEAGLAGGFVVKGKEAKQGRFFSLSVFVIIVASIFFINLYLFDKSDFINITWNTFLFKLLINAPLIWVATIANLNLNKFSRLEQEYSHKEALAKSYERYKEEIEQLENLGVDGAGAMKLKLLEINLDAFKVNPAVNSEKERSGFTILNALGKDKK
ncbi:hypothetical protein [Alloalcanivorax marinus]|uniref:hypothetical protein n=1 Tax=Alloalcanivorax marinus TaxID=1177169 RepID=UPI00195E8551|nr:hypothetical protein [Alloalcanivorax marinus]MBM7334984.1 hypothetical protein [Alloalcanivorax marinus]